MEGKKEMDEAGYSSVGETGEKQTLVKKTWPILVLSGPFYP